MKKSIVYKIKNEDGETIYLVDTHGYGAAWSSDKSDARIFKSIASAKWAAEQTNAFVETVIQETL